MSTEMAHTAKSILSLFLFITCVGVPSGLAQGLEDREAASKVIALERVWKLQAVPAKDLRTLDQLLDEAFVYVDQQGSTFSKRDVLMDLQRADPVQLAVESLDVKLHGTSIVATGVCRMKRMEGGKAVRSRFIDTWIFKGGNWVAIASIATPTAD